MLFVGFCAGDPHFMTLDGYSFTFNGLGEYILAASPNVMIQV